MRKLKSLMFAATLLLSSFGASATFAQQAAAPSSPLQAAEYNVGFCGGRGFTEAHMVVATQASKSLTQTITITDFMTDPETVKRDDDPLVFSVKNVEVKGDDVKFSAEATIPNEDESGSYLVLMNGYVYKNKIVTVITVDGKLSKVQYGRVGILADLKGEARSDFEVCTNLRDLEVEAIPTAVVAWLHQVTTPAAEKP